MPWRRRNVKELLTCKDTTIIPEDPYAILAAVTVQKVMLLKIKQVYICSDSMTILSEEQAPARSFGQLEAR